MSERRLDTLKQLYNKVKAGEIDESKLRVVLDNDCTLFYVENPDNDDDDEIIVAEANGYYDIEKLYPLLFPGATVEWC